MKQSIGFPAAIHCQDGYNGAGDANKQTLSFKKGRKKAAWFIGIIFPGEGSFLFYESLM